MVIFHSYVSLPEGKHVLTSMIILKFFCGWDWLQLHVRPFFFIDIETSMKNKPDAMHIIDLGHTNTHTHIHTHIYILYE